MVQNCLFFLHNMERLKVFQSVMIGVNFSHSYIDQGHHFQLSIRVIKSFKKLLTFVGSDVKIV